MKTLTIAALMMAAVSTGAVAQSVTVTADPASTTIKEFNQRLYNMGIRGTGDVQEIDSDWCVFNDWAARDQQAHRFGTYENGRHSIGTTFGGRWYCTAKR
jgi:hypothetical protein